MPPAKKPAPKKPADAEEEKDPPEGDEEEQPDARYVTPAQLNAALASFARKKLPKLLESSLSSALASVGFKPKAEAQEDDEEEEGDEEGEGAKPAEKAPTKPKKGAAEEPQVNSKEAKKLEKLRKELDAIKAEKEADKAKAAKAEERQRLVEALTAQGVRKEMIAPLATYLLSEESGRLVRRNAEGAIVFAQADDDGDVDELKLGEGLATYLKSDAGKVYVAPRGAQGSNNVGAGAGVGAKGSRVNGDPQAQSKAALDQQLFGLVMGLPLDGGAQQ